MISSLEVVSKSLKSIAPDPSVASAFFASQPMPQNNDPTTSGVASAPWDSWKLTNFSDLELSQSLHSANVDDSQEESFRFYVATAVIVAAVLGLLFNLFVMVLSFFCIRGDYRHFIANLAFVDIICAILFTFMGYANITDRKQFSPTVMAYSALAFYGSFGVMVCALVPVSISRVVAASNPKIYDKLFSGKRAVAVCLLSDTIPIAILVAICIAPLAPGRYLFYLYAILTFAAYLVAFVSNSMVFLIVKSHISVVQCLHDRTRLIETKQVAFATLAQALIPLVCQVPAFLTLSSALLLIDPFSDGTVIVVTQLWLAASPFFDALITLFVIKRYRVQTFAFLTALVECDLWQSSRRHHVTYCSNGSAEGWAKV
ncbi:hypothetical protein QR680_002253 [Steinernema hermaphroditum]|uniref:G-protein coupled receptors family 1 profile domain-containing protein n=1 Tax=Steinernema hermaphroditum TaxID=289476 RepID=A0AA39H3R9_9BILA|nr:hypothetical protein QR680_002253 [Steinernema hermaphroditum]